MNRIQRVRRFRLASLAMTLGALLTVSGLPLAATTLAASSATVSINPASEPAAGPGATFTVNVVSNATVASGGVQASVTFDKTLLQITSVARGAGWSAAPVFIGPSGDQTVAANLATSIANANTTGDLNTIAASYTDPAGGSVPTGNADFLDITFQVIACGTGTTNISLPVGPSDTVVTDTAGSVIIPTTSGSVVTPCSGNTGNTTTHVTSSLTAGYLSLTLQNGADPTGAALAIPLARGVTNTATETAVIFSDGNWTLNVADAMPSGKLVGDRGHLTDANPSTKRLAAPMQAYVPIPPATNPPGLLIRTLDQPTANTNVWTGSASQNVPVVLSQVVGPTDPPASYSIILVFTATSGF